MSTPTNPILESPTPFDDAFKTLMERIPFLIIPVLNEVFGTSYDISSSKVLLRNSEHHTLCGKIVQDSRIFISGSEYFTECESTQDKTIFLRMVEYMIAGTLEDTYQSGIQGETCHLNLPTAFILFLRSGVHSGKIKYGNILLNFSGKLCMEVRIPAVCLSCWSLDEILTKKLFFFLPFYFIRYEASMKKAARNPEELQKKLNQEYLKIQDSLQVYFKNTNQAYCQYLLTDLILLVLNHITPKEGVFRNEVDQLMRGHSISTPTTISFDQGFELGKEQGIQTGIQTGIQQGFQHETQTIVSLIKDGLITLSKASEVLHIPEKELAKMI